MVIITRSYFALKKKKKVNPPPNPRRRPFPSAVDLSVWAFERLADKKWGVIGIKWREVPCDANPEKLAPRPANPTPRGRR